MVHMCGGCQVAIVHMREPDGTARCDICVCGLSLLVLKYTLMTPVGDVQCAVGTGAVQALVSWPWHCTMIRTGPTHTCSDQALPVGARHVLDPGSPGHSVQESKTAEVFRPPHPGLMATSSLLTWLLLQMPFMPSCTILAACNSASAATPVSTNNQVCSAQDAGVGQGQHGGHEIWPVLQSVACCFAG